MGPFFGEERFRVEIISEGGRVYAKGDFGRRHDGALLALPGGVAFAERFRGTEGSELHRGTAGKDTIYALTGDDNLFGKGGEDRIFGNRDDDIGDGFGAGRGDGTASRSICGRPSTTCSRGSAKGRSWWATRITEALPSRRASPATGYNCSPRSGRTRNASTTPGRCG